MTWRKKSFDSEKDGSPVQSLTELSFPPEEPFVILRFINVKPYKNEGFLREKYLEERLSIREIASLCFSARSTISSNLKAFGIEIREEEVAHSLNKGQVGYGEKRVKREAQTHRRELENIEKMKELRRQGFSYHKIAAIFNSMGVPTKNKKKWHATTVMKILKSNSKL